MSTPYECKTCEGTGRLYVGGFFMGMSFVCRDCDGTGWSDDSPVTQLASVYEVHAT